jgi:hypothetical protein
MREGALAGFSTAGNTFQLDVDGDGEHRSPEGRVIEWTFVFNRPELNPLVWLQQLHTQHSASIRRIWVRGVGLGPGANRGPDLLLERWSPGPFDFTHGRPCRYRFDELRATVPEGTPMPRTWTKRGDQYVRYQGGSYLSHDAHVGWRHSEQPAELFMVDPGPNPLDGRRAWGDWSELSALEDVQPMDLRVFAHEWKATRLEWRFQGRLVHLAVRQAPDVSDLQLNPDDYWHFCADGWDNCHDRDLRSYLPLSRP